MTIVNKPIPKLRMKNPYTLIWYQQGMSEAQRNRNNRLFWEYEARIHKIEKEEMERLQKASIRIYVK